jgi:hypothetical protein
MTHLIVIRLPVIFSTSTVGRWQIAGVHASSAQLASGERKQHCRPEDLHLTSAAFKPSA